MKLKVKWLDEPPQSSLEHAKKYCELKFGQPIADAAHHALSHAATKKYEAKDLLRACNRQALPMVDSGVQRALADVRAGTPGNPLLIIQTPRGPDIADGYHHLSLVYHLDPTAKIPARIGVVRGRAS